MGAPASPAWIIAAVCALIFCALHAEASALGMNYGTQSYQALSPGVVVKLLQSINITKVKLFDYDTNIIKAFAGTNIEVMVAIPNKDLANIASSVRNSESWVDDHVKTYLFSGGVNIKYIAVGNEPFLKSYNGSYANVTVPALENVQNSLVKLKISDKVKATVPLNADVLDHTDTPSKGVFRSDILQTMTDLVTALNKTASPFTINVYPFLSLDGDPNFPKEYAYFDGSYTTKDGDITYTNVFDASYDALVSALNSVGFPNMAIFVGEAGWPTDAQVDANINNAKRFNQGLVKHISKGTPLRQGPLEVYLFGLLDEDAKSIDPGSFERHWGIYGNDGQAKYALDLTGTGLNNTLVNASGVNHLTKQWCILDPKGDKSKLADNVAYACTYADCTALVDGGSCNSLGSDGNASYAFNSYYQLNKQRQNTCYFEGLAKVTSEDPSIGTCVFKIGFTSSSIVRRATNFIVVLATVFVIVILL